MEIVKPYRGRKKVIMLTATPINTAYRDISNQLALVTHEGGNTGDIDMFRFADIAECERKKAQYADPYY